MGTFFLILSKSKLEIFFQLLFLNVVKYVREEYVLIYLGGHLINGFVEQKVFPFMNACYFSLLDFYLARRHVINSCAPNSKAPNIETRTGGYKRRIDKSQL